MQLSELQGEKLFKYLKENKEALISAKKSQTKYTDSLSHPIISAKREVATPKKKEETSKDSSTVPEVEVVVASDSVDVTVVCNTAWFCDSQMDVLTGTSYDNSVKAKGISIPHIADHKQSSTAHVGDVTAVYTKELPLKELGLDQSGSTVALVMETIIRKDYNEDVYKFYDNGKINQHSIGLRYVDIQLAINNHTEEYKDELAIWDEFYPQVINKDFVDARGYFYLVSEIDIIENSCVLFGANALTPTLNVKSETILPIEEIVTIAQQDVVNVVKNDETVVQTVLTKGAYMNIEELQAEVIKLGAELEKAKAETSLVMSQATSKEQGRILGIIEAKKTFSTPLEAAIKFIKSGSSVDNAVTAFETIKEFSQVENRVDVDIVVTPSVSTTDFPEKEKTAMELLLAMKAAGTDNPSKGLL